jgi:4-diphosphocytidyl-2C-methyl-D-erythritol kinase
LTENFSFIDYYNDLQKYVFKVYPEIKKHYDNLNNFKKRKIIVNGSGSYLIIFHLY